MQGIEQEAFVLASQINAELIRADSELTKLHEHISSSEDLISSRLRTFDAWAHQAQSAATGLCDLVDTEIETQLDRTGDACENALSEFQQLIKTMSAQLTHDGGALAICVSLTNEVSEITDQLDTEIDTLGQDLDEALVTYDSLTEAITSNLISAQDEMTSEVADEAQFLVDDVEEHVLVPLREAAEAIQTNWERLFDEKVAQVLSELFDGIEEEIRSPMTDAVEDLAGLLEAELERLVQELIGGDVEGESVRADLEGSLDMLMEAFEPLESAFEAFKGLASSVGVDI